MVCLVVGVSGCFDFIRGEAALYRVFVGITPPPSLPLPHSHAALRMSLSETSSELRDQKQQLRDVFDRRKKVGFGRKE